MNIELFIAKRLFRKGKGSFTRPVINISVAGVAIGITVIILAVAILKGFQNEIRDKIIGFGSHIQITLFDDNLSYETTSLKYDTVLVEKLSEIPGIVHVQPYGIKAGVIKTEDQIEGIVLKGVNHNYDWSFFKNTIIEGSVPEIEHDKRSNETLISSHTARKMKFETGDRIILYFIQDPPRYRSFVVAGIYETGLQEFDERFMFADIRHIKRLNDWSENEISGLEVLINDFTKLDEVTDLVNKTIPYDYIAENIRELNPQLFGWLKLMDKNVIIILIVTILVALIHMTSVLLILIIERTNMIGVLKAIGMSGAALRKLFLINGSFLLLKGILIGNVIAIAIGIIQNKTGIITLDQESYFLDKVPIELQLLDILALNVGVFIICTVVMMIPAFIIGKISPVKAIRYD